MAPAVYANTRDVGRLSKHGGDITVVPIIFFSDNPDSYGLRALFEERGVRGKGEFEGLTFKPSPVLAAKVLGLTVVEDIIDPPCTVIGYDEEGLANLSRLESVYPSRGVL